MFAAMSLVLHTRIDLCQLDALVTSMSQRGAVCRLSNNLHVIEVAKNCLIVKEDAAEDQNMRAIQKGNETRGKRRCIIEGRQSIKQRGVRGSGKKSTYIGNVRVARSFLAVVIVDGTVHADI
jgi:hypothetical protein